MVTTNKNWLYDGVRKVPRNVITVVVQHGVQKIHHDAFSNCQKLISIEIPDTLEIIGSFAFLNCFSLVSIELPSSVKVIRHSVFAHCTSLSSVKLPVSITEIGCNVFLGCESLISINLPPSITTIESSTFEGCKSLTLINLPSTIQKIKKKAFTECVLLTSINLPPSIEFIGDCAFYGCNSLTSIEVSSSIRSIGEDVFFGCESLETIQIKSSITQTHPGIVESVKDLVSLIPQVTRTKCTPYCIWPLHLFLMFGHVYYYRDGIKNLIRKAPSSLTIQDPIYNMYPFLLAACTPCTPDSRDLLKNEVEVSVLKGTFDLHHLETVYMLLREAPWVLNFLLWKSPYVCTIYE